jgi:hypothetical protein
VCPSAGVSVDVRLLGAYRMVIGSLNADGTSTFVSMWPDASGERPLTTATGTAAAADWAVLSPDGRKLATATGGTITVSFLDGSAPDQTATVCCRIERPEWSPDSTQLTFEADAPNPDPNFPGSFVNAIWTVPLATPPQQSLNPQPLTYQVPDGTGGTKTADVEGYNPVFGSGGSIVFATSPTKTPPTAARAALGAASLACGRSVPGNSQPSWYRPPRRGRTRSKSRPGRWTGTSHFSAMSRTPPRTNACSTCMSMTFPATAQQ